MSKKITKFCPNCLNQISYEEGSHNIQCLYCDSFLTEDQLKDSTYSGRPMSANAAGYVSNITPAAVIDSADSGLAFLEHYYERYNWDEYQTTSELFESQILDLVEKNKYKNANNSSAWLLEFRSISIPLKKKIEGLDNLKKEITRDYTGIDDTDLYNKLDIYSKTLENIISKKEDLLKILETDIKYFAKYGGDAATIKQLTKEIEEIKKVISKLVMVVNFEDIKEIAEGTSKRDKEIAKLYEEKGINAQLVYKEAIITLSFSNDQSKALELFSKISQYRKSLHFIKLINRIFKIGELYQFGNLLFTTQSDKINEESAFDMKEMATVVKVPTFSLYEIIDGVPEEKPLVKNISYILSTYGNDMFYIESGKRLCSFDVSTGSKRILDTGETGDYIYKNNSVFLSPDGTSFYIKKKINIKKDDKGRSGCASLFKKKEVAKIDTSERLNNYSILSVNMKLGKVKKVVYEIVDIIDFYNDTIFYTVAKKNELKDIITTLHMLDMDNNVCKQIIDHNCLIHEVTDEKVVYTLWNPNTLNQDLFILDKETLEKTLIETNIYNFFAIINKKVYYTVGNADYLPLFSNNFEGTDRREIMQNIENIFRISAGWMYVIKRLYYNNALIKVSEDGKTRHVICSDFKKIIELKNGYIYYLDKYDSLHIVRSDGRDDKEIAREIIADKLIIDNNYIYYMRKELVDKEHSSYSMYRMDLDGHNVKKMWFNIVDMKQYDENTIYFSYLDKIKFEIVTPYTIDKYSHSYKTYFVKKFVSYNKIVDEYSELLTLGLPAKTLVDVKKPGCSGKKIKKEVKFIQLPTIIQYPKRGGAQIGAVEAERELKALKEQAAKKVLINNNAGCSTVKK